MYVYSIRVMGEIYFTFRPISGYSALSVYLVRLVNLVGKEELLNGCVRI